MGCHLDKILSSSTSSIHALRMLRSHRLGSPQLFEVARSTTLASMLYISTAWWGFTTAQDSDRLGRLIGRLQRGGFLPAQVRSFGDLAAEADRRLFRAAVIDPHHVLSRLLCEVKSTSYNLRPGSTASSFHQRILAISSCACFMRKSIASDASACALVLFLKAAFIINI